MTDSEIEELAREIEALADEHPERLAELLAAHEPRLREERRFKLLAFAFYSAGDIKVSHKYLNRVAREELDERELRLAATIRHESRLRRRMRFGLYLPSDKRFTKRIIDGASNLLRHGRLRNATSVSAAIGRDLRGPSEQIRLARDKDVRRLRTLLDRHEDEFRARGHAKFLAFNYYHAGSLAKAARYAEDLDPSDLSAKERAFLANILFEHCALAKMRDGEAPIAVDRPDRDAVAARGPHKALYLAASSRPFILSGYTSRTDALVTAMQRSERLSLVPVTRPGFPKDRSDAKNLARVGDSDLLFDQLGADAPFRGDLEAYLTSNLPALERYAREHGVDTVHAASNYRNGVIGLALARRMGLPFVYEIRGLWEETTDTKLVGWRDTERFEYERLFERYLARSADGVLCINAQVRAVLDLEERDNVRLLPNCVGEEAIVERATRAGRKGLRIGYVGSILEYEGLDDLILAVANLSRRHEGVRLDIYGRGPDQQRLKDLVADLGIEGVMLHGPVDPKEVASLYAGFDLCVFPRKPYRVCQLVTPLKPLEAMANDVNVIVSDVAPMATFASNGAASSFTAGDVPSLVDAIASFMAMDPDQRAAHRAQARDMLRRHYVWERQDAVIADVYDAAARGNEAATQEERS